MRSRSLLIPALACGLAALPGCDAVTGSPAPSCLGACSPSAAPAIPEGRAAMDVELHGSASVSGSYVVDGLPLCADQVKPAAGGNGYVVPDNPDGDRVGAHVLTVDVTVSPERFHGPGTYAAADLDATRTAITVDDGDDLQPNGAQASTTLTLRADGGGSIHFEGWTDAAGHTLGGTLQWSCADHAGPPAATPS